MLKGTVRSPEEGVRQTDIFQSTSSSDIILIISRLDDQLSFPVEGSPIHATFLQLVEKRMMR